MNKLLTIVIPTFNRAKLLEQQLIWLTKAIQGFESECEIIISDNCSTDNTQEVVNKWQPKFQETIFKSNRQSQNIGLMNNIAACKLLPVNMSGQLVMTTQFKKELSVMC